MPADADTRELRRRLLDAGRAVFARCGYAAATVDDVIAEAGTSRATFYRYFRNKDDLFVELSHACFRELHAVLETLADLGDNDDTEAQVAAALEHYERVRDRHAGAFRAWMERSAEPDDRLREASRLTVEAFTDSLAGALATRGLPSDVDLRVRAHLLYYLLDRPFLGRAGVPRGVGPPHDPVADGTLARMIDRTFFRDPELGALEAVGPEA